MTHSIPFVARTFYIYIQYTSLGVSKLFVISVLLEDTSLQPRLSTSECHVFVTAIGTPQDDSSSPVLLTVYLKVAFRGLRSRLPMGPPADASFPFDVEYAHNTDFII